MHQHEQADGNDDHANHQPVRLQLAQENVR